MNSKWDNRFMDLSRHVAQWSKDPSTKCGAVIVNENNKVLGFGFNGFASGTDDSPERYADRESKYTGVIHCEENAILNSSVPLYGTSIYLMAMSCDRCAARVIQVGIQDVVVPHPTEDPFFYRDDWRGSFERSAEQFAQAGVGLHILESTGFDARDLMGPLHPYWEGKSHEHFEQFDRR